jgi:hypothetical protein
MNEVEILMSENCCSGENLIPDNCDPPFLPTLVPKNAGAHAMPLYYL